MPGKTEDLASTLETLRGDYRTLVERLEANQREFQRLRLLTAEEEVQLAKEMEAALDLALDALLNDNGVVWPV